MMYKITWHHMQSFTASLHGLQGSSVVSNYDDVFNMTQ